MTNSILETISNEFATAADKVGGSVVAVHGRRWMPASGIEWKKGVIVTAHHGVQRDEDIEAPLAGGRAASAQLARRDPSTDLAQRDQTSSPLKTQGVTIMGISGLTSPKGWP
jgi:serine protease Do